MAYTPTRCSPTADAAQVLAMHPVLPGICQGQKNSQSQSWDIEVVCNPKVNTEACDLGKLKKEEKKKKVTGHTQKQVQGGVGKRTREGNNLYKKMKDNGSY